MARTPTRKISTAIRQMALKRRKRKYYKKTGPKAFGDWLAKNRRAEEYSALFKRSDQELQKYLDKIGSKIKPNIFRIFLNGRIRRAEAEAERAKKRVERIPKKIKGTKTQKKANTKKQS